MPHSARAMNNKGTLLFGFGLLALSPEAAERIGGAVFWTEGETVGSLAEHGALELISRIEVERGERFPQREGKVKTGRPRKPSSDPAV